MNLLRTLMLVALIAGWQPISAQINNSSGSIVGNGQISKETRDIGMYDRLLVDFAVKVRITEGDPARAELEGEQNVLPYITVAVNKGELTIGLSRKAKFKETKPITVTIHWANLQTITANTACSLTSDLPIEVAQLTIALHEACKLTAPLQVRQLDVNLTAASSVTIRGKADKALFRVEAASQVAARELTVAKADVNLSGASRAVVHVTETLSASADGVSSIRYSGNPTVTLQQATGLSTIRRSE